MRGLQPRHHLALTPLINRHPAPAPAPALALASAPAPASVCPTTSFRVFISTPLSSLTARKWVKHTRHVTVQSVSAPKAAAAVDCRIAHFTGAGVVPTVGSTPREARKRGGGCGGAVLEFWVPCFGDDCHSKCRWCRPLVNRWRPLRPPQADAL